MVKRVRVLVLVALDFFIINFSYIAAFLIRFDFDVNSAAFNQWFDSYADHFLPISAITLLVFAGFRLYTSMWRYAGVEELVKIALASVAGSLLTLAYMMLVASRFMPRGIYIISCVLILLLLMASRLAHRIFRTLRSRESLKSVISRLVGGEYFRREIVKVMVVGAGDAGATIIKEIKRHPEYGKRVAVVIDDDPAKIGQRISGVKIAGDHTKIRKIARRYGINEIIIAIPSAGNKVIQNIAGECSRTFCKIKTLPGLIDIIDGRVSVSKLRDVAIEDLLGRESVELNTREISGYLEGKIVMVTGGGGSIGSELCRQIARYRPRRLVALDIYENTLFELANEIKAKFPALEFEAVIGSIRNKERMQELFQKYKPHVVFHAAAHKHVPLMEKNPKEAVLNNILGAKNMVDFSDAYAVESFVMISTDKAVNPANVMGATKRVAEMILQEKSGMSGTRFSAVRFGNVLGSNGSVLPIFRKQIENGGPVTVTHPDITRFFMTIPEAVALVIQTGAMADGGEIFVLDMGEPVKIMDLAENVIRLSGYVPNADIDIEIVGLRPGEKLYEELLLTEEGIEKTAHNMIYVGHPLAASPALKTLLEPESTTDFESKVQAVVRRGDDEVRAWLQTLVPNYTPEK